MKWTRRETVVLITGKSTVDCWYVDVEVLVCGTGLTPRVVLGNETRGSSLMSGTEDLETGVKVMAV